MHWKSQLVYQEKLLFFIDHFLKRAYCTLRLRYSIFGQIYIQTHIPIELEIISTLCQFKTIWKLYKEKLLFQLYLPLCIIIKNKTKSEWNIELSKTIMYSTSVHASRTKSFLLHYLERKRAFFNPFVCRIFMWNLKRTFSTCVFNTFLRLGLHISHKCRQMKWNEKKKTFST